MTTPTQTKSSKAEYIKSLAWLIEATFNAYVGYMLLAHFRHNYVADVAGIYALASAGLIVVVHFIKAHNN
jgi:hypothetical protein